MALASGGSAETAVALAIPLGALGTVLHNLTMTAQAAFVHRADTYAEQGNVRGVKYSNIAAQIISFAERFL